MFKEHDIVRIKKDDPEHGVRDTYIGVIVDVLTPGLYTVEFMDENAETITKALYRFYTDAELVPA